MAEPEGPILGPQTFLEANKEASRADARDAASLKARQLSTLTPKPNIVRIEVLDGLARQRYLGGIQQFGDFARAKAFAHLSGEANKVFYGFLKNTGTQNFGFSSAWSEQRQGSGNLTQSLKKLSNEFDIARGVVGAATGIVEIGEKLTGTNSTYTGSSSIRQYGGTSLDDMSVECGWYLPEQLELCIKSLQVLHKMGYPLQIDQKDLTKGMKDLIENSLTEFAKLFTGNKDIGVVGRKVVGTASTGGEVAMKALNSFNRALGRNITFDPLPVRLSIGHYADLEPLVITKLDIIFSKETFVDESGKHNRHLPITCTVKIDFKFWLTPAPKLEFAKLLGSEMFGQSNTIPTPQKIPPDPAHPIITFKEAVTDPLTKTTPASSSSVIITPPKKGSIPKGYDPLIFGGVVEQ